MKYEMSVKEFVFYMVVFAVTFGILGGVIGHEIKKQDAIKAGVATYISNDDGKPEFVYTNSKEFKEYLKKHSEALEKSE